MAQRVEVLLEDDIDGSPAGETVRFAYDGTQYEIDLSSQNAGPCEARPANTSSTLAKHPLRRVRPGQPGTASITRRYAPGPGPRARRSASAGAFRPR
jgi:hypothetical protein